jgi:hypothetical protein
MNLKSNLLGNQTRLPGLEPPMDASDETSQ